MKSRIESADFPGEQAATMALAQAFLSEVFMLPDLGSVNSPVICSGESLNWLGTLDCRANLREFLKGIFGWRCD